MTMMVTRPPSMDPARGVRALETAILRLDTVHSQFGTDVPPAQVALGLSNVAAMYQQALTIGRYNLPNNDTLNGGFQQAMDGTMLLGRQLKAGTAPAIPEIETMMATWRTAATDGITAFRAPAVTT